MSKRTILLITESTLGRFDLSGGGTPSVTDSWVRPSFASQSVGTLVDAALRLGKSRNRQVYVLTTRCWTGSVSLLSDVTAQASGDELNQMVALEAEAFSGISAFESAFASQALPPDELGDNRYWLTQIQDQDLRSIQDAVRQAGGKLLGVAHPAVPTIDAPSTPTEEWRSFQNWDESTLLIRGCGEAIADFHSMSSGLQSQRTVQEFVTFFKGLDSDTTLQCVGLSELPPLIADLPEAKDNRQVDTTSESDLKAWAAAWMRSQNKQSVGLPLVTIPKRPMSREVGISIAAVLGLVMMGSCFAHYRYLKGNLTEVNASIEQIQDQQNQLNEDQKKLTELEKQQNKIASETAALEKDAQQVRSEVVRAQQIIQRGRLRWPSLVDSLIEVSDDDGWVREIRSTDQAVAIRGLAIEDAAVHRLAARLESTNASDQWKIFPARTSVSDESRLIEFTIDLVAIGREKADSKRSRIPSSTTSRRGRYVRKP
ncbi:MAG: hypothetical protein AAGG48_04795 [Planctomycetota bacterium]